MYASDTEDGGGELGTGEVADGVATVAVAADGAEPGMARDGYGKKGSVRDILRDEAPADCSEPEDCAGEKDYWLTTRLVFIDVFKSLFCRAVRREARQPFEEKEP